MSETLLHTEHFTATEHRGSGQPGPTRAPPRSRHPELQVYNIQLSSHESRLSLNWRHRYRSCQVLFYQALLLPQASGQALCSRTQASPQGLRAMKELNHYVTRCFSNTFRGQSHSGQGWPVRTTGLGAPAPPCAHALAARGTPHLSEDAEDFLAQSADHLLTSGPEIPSKDLMHQGSSLCLPIQPKRKPQP